MSALCFGLFKTRSDVEQMCEIPHDEELLFAWREQSTVAQGTTIDDTCLAYTLCANGEMIAYKSTRRILNMQASKWYRKIITEVDAQKELAQLDTMQQMYLIPVSVKSFLVEMFKRIIELQHVLSTE